MFKIFIGIITDKGEYNNLNALTSIWSDFDGLAVTYHGKPEDDEYKLIQERKKGGFIECIKYMNHGHSMSHFLFNPIIKLGDWILLRDGSERINESFAFNIKPFIKNLENLGINTVYQRSKLLMFKRFPHQSFVNHPHWAFLGAQDKRINIEQTGWFEKDEDYCYSARKERAPLSWVNHYLKYFLSLDSNHSLLGAENFGNPSDIFQQKEQFRLQFLLYLQKLGINNDKDSLISYWKNNELTSEMKYFISTVRILNDAWLYNIKGDTNLTDDIKRPCQLIP